MKYNILSSLLKKTRYASPANYSYSQCGEDIIVRRVLGKLGIKKPTYLDVGANDPVKLNNTYLFYTKGGKGVLVEPDPDLCKILKKVRPNDTIINAGIGTDEEGTADFYIMSNKLLNTFSPEEAENISKYDSNKVEQTVEVPLLNINHFIKDSFTSCPNFISIDIEGLDFKVVNSLNFDQY